MKGARPSDRSKPRVASSRAPYCNSPSCSQGAKNLRKLRRAGGPRPQRPRSQWDVGFNQASRFRRSRSDRGPVALRFGCGFAALRPMPPGVTICGDDCARVQPRTAWLELLQISGITHRYADPVVAALALVQGQKTDRSYSLVPIALSYVSPKSGFVMGCIPLPSIPLTFRLAVILKEAVETTDGHRWTQIRRSYEKTGDHPEGEPFFPEESVCLCVHLWFPFSG